MKIKCKILILLSVLMPAMAWAQSSTMRFDGDEWDFGRIREVDGVVEHTFTFTNTGRVAFVIEQVKVSCGCTAPVFSKDPVLPGKKGSITIKYDPRERAGVFIHDISIVSSKGRNRNTLRIRGEVVPRPRSVEDDYPYLYHGGLRFSVLSLNFGMVGQGEARSMTIGYANTSQKAVSLGFVTPAERKFLTVDAPQTVAPGARGEVTVTYDLRHTTFYGRYSDRIVPVIDGKRQDLVFSTIFTAVDSRKGVELDNAPGIVVNPMLHDFGKVRRTDRLVRRVRISNDGRQPLVIRWVNAKPPVTTTLREGTTVQPGAGVEFTVTMDASGLDSGLNTGSVTVISNDPLRPVREIRVAANVE